MAAARKRRSLATLLTADSVTQPQEDEEAPRTALLDELAPHPDNPRDDLDGDKSVEELAATLTELGQIHAAIVISSAVYLRRHPEHANTLGSARWVVLSGNRRLAAARKAGMSTLKIEVQDGLGAEDDDHLDDAVMIANIHQANLPPLREAAYLARMVKRHGSQHKVAKRLGKTQPWISQRLDLLKLIPELQTALTAGELRVKEARPLARLTPERQHEIWEDGPPYVAPDAPKLATGGDNRVITPDTDPRSPDVPSQRESDETAASESDNPVITREPPAGTMPSDRDDQAARGRGDNPVITPDTDPRSANPTADMLVIRVPAHNTAALAGELADRLTPAELAELAGILVDQIGA